MAVPAEPSSRDYHAVVVGDGTLALPYPHPVNIALR